MGVLSGLTPPYKDQMGTFRKALLAQVHAPSIKEPTAEDCRRRLQSSFYVMKIK